MIILLSKIPFFLWLVPTFALIAFTAWFARVSIHNARRRPKLWKPIILLIVFASVIGACIPTNFVAYRRAWQLVHPYKNPARVLPESAGIQHYLDVRFPTSDGIEIAAWFIPGRLSASVIFLNGFSANRSRFLPEAQLLNQQGFNILLMDCRACGESSGALNTFGLREIGDVRAGLDFLAARTSIDPDRIGLVGHSQGGATAILAAAQIPEVRAVVSISAFTSLEDNLKNAVSSLIGLPPFPFVQMVVFWGEWITGLDLGEVRPIDAIPYISPRPILIIQGEQDSLVPVDNARRLFSAAGEPKQLLIIPEAGHSNISRLGGELFKQTLIDFFQDALLDPAHH